MIAMQQADGAAIHRRHRFHEKVMRDRCSSVFYDASIMNPESNLTRTLTLVLPEADWKALREAEPDAIGWLRAQIQNRLATQGGPWTSNASPAPATTAESWWGNEDEY
jgi:hypothetical protein